MAKTKNQSWRNAKKGQVEKRHRNKQGVFLPKSMSLIQALHTVFSGSDSTAVMIFMDPNGESTWLPFFRTWTGLRFDEEKNKIVGLLKFDDEQNTLKQVSVLRMIAHRAQEIASSFEGIAADIESTMGINFNGELEEVPQDGRDVN